MSSATVADTLQVEVVAVVEEGGVEEGVVVDAAEAVEEGVVVVGVEVTHKVPNARGLGVMARFLGTFALFCFYITWHFPSRFFLAMFRSI